LATAPSTELLLVNMSWYLQDFKLACEREK
jgi:hypothetical protein